MACQPWKLFQPSEISIQLKGCFRGPFPSKSYDYISTEIQAAPKRKRHRTSQTINKDWKPGWGHSECVSIFCQRQYEKRKDYLLHYIRGKLYCSECVATTTHDQITYLAEHEFMEENPRPFKLQAVTMDELKNEYQGEFDEDEEEENQYRAKRARKHEFCVRLHAQDHGLDSPRLDVLFIGADPLKSTA